MRQWYRWGWRKVFGDISRQDIRIAHRCSRVNTKHETPSSGDLSRESVWQSLRWFHHVALTLGQLPAGPC